MIPFLVILAIAVVSIGAIYLVASASHDNEQRSESSVDEVRVVEHPPGYYTPQWKPAGYDWWIDLDPKSRSLDDARVRARQYRNYLKACEEPERIHGVDEEGGDT